MSRKKYNPLYVVFHETIWEEVEDGEQRVVDAILYADADDAMSDAINESEEGEVVAVVELNISSAKLMKVVTTLTSVH